MKRYALLVSLATPVAIAFGVVFALAGEPLLSEQQARNAAYEALGSLGQRCLNGAEISRRQPTPDEVDRDVAGTTGWSHGVFVGSVDDLAAEFQATITSKSPRTVWILLRRDDGERGIFEFSRIDLPSGRTGWILGENAETGPCD